MAGPRYEDHRRHMLLVVRAVLDAADPGEAVRRAYAPGAKCAAYVAVGKAAGAMAAAFQASEREAGRSEAPAVVLTVDGVAMPEGLRAEVLRGDHPLPTERNVRAAERVLAVVEAARESARDGGAELVVLVSGGASALLSMPAEGLTLEDVREVTRGLLRAGATIGELNAVRKHIERLKGGRLAAAAAPLGVRAYMLSDVIGDDLATIGSGPVSPDATTYGDALRVLAERGLGGGGSRVRAFLEAGARGELPETPKPGDAVFARVRAEVVAGNSAAVDAAARAVGALGFTVVRVEHGVRGEAREVGERLGRELRAWREAAEGRPLAVVAGGETTVTVRGSGYGGRNGEMAAAAALALDRCGRVALLAFGTDGADGTTPRGAEPAAGAVVTGETAAESRSSGADLQDALRANDSYRALAAVGALVRTGPTGTNVNDVAVGLVY